MYICFIKSAINSKSPNKQTNKQNNEQSLYCNRETLRTPTRVGAAKGAQKPMWDQTGMDPSAS